MPSWVSEFVLLSVVRFDRMVSWYAMFFYAVLLGKSTKQGRRRGANDVLRGR